MITGSVTLSYLAAKAAPYVNRALNNALAHAQSSCQQAVTAFANRAVFIVQEAMVVNFSRSNTLLMENALNTIDWLEHHETPEFYHQGILTDELDTLETAYRRSHFSLFGRNLMNYVDQGLRQRAARTVARYRYPHLFVEQRHPEQPGRL